MADLGEMAKSRKKNKLSFLMDEEEGELSDTSDECHESAAKKKRDLDFINEWSEKVKLQKIDKSDESTMELESDTEESKINVKPVAMTITLSDDSFSKKHRGVIETQMVMKYGPENVDASNNCIFVTTSKPSKEIVNNLVVPLGVMFIVFHDEDFCKENFDFISNFCKELFGSSKVTCDKFVIEVVQNDLLDFEVDTDTNYGRDEVIYLKPESGCIPEKQPTRRRNPIVPICFNCEGNHSLSECKERRNRVAIFENKEKFRKQKLKSNARYHAEADKFSGFAPGYLSANLRNALGIEADEIPRHIYEMRKLGYPPAWLLEARVAHSGVSVYGSKGVVPEEGDEEGEVFEEGEKDRYDIKKIVKYPGFNTMPAQGVVDEHEKFGCPPMSESQEISEMIRRLAPNAYQAYKKKKSLKIKVSPEESSTSLDGKSPPHTTDTPLDISSTPVARKTPENAETPKDRPRNASIDLGTPLLPSSSPFAKLPDRDKFGVNITDVINFENLPNSTGTYEKVASSIAKIRDFVAQNNVD